MFALFPTTFKASVILLWSACWSIPVILSCHFALSLYHKAIPGGFLQLYETTQNIHRWQFERMMESYHHILPSNPTPTITHCRHTVPGSNWYTLFCEFLAEFSQINRQTLQFICNILHIYLSICGKPWKRAIFFSNFRKLTPTQHRTELGNTRSNGEMQAVISGLAPRSFL